MRPLLTTKMCKLKLLGHEFKKYEKPKICKVIRKKVCIYAYIHVHVYEIYLHTLIVSKIKSNNINALTLCKHRNGAIREGQDGMLHAFFFFFFFLMFFAVYPHFFHARHPTMIVFTLTIDGWLPCPGLLLGGRTPYITSKNRLCTPKLHIKDVPLAF